MKHPELQACFAARKACLQGYQMRRIRYVQLTQGPGSPDRFALQKFFYHTVCSLLISLGLRYGVTRQCYENRYQLVALFYKRCIRCNRALHRELLRERASSGGFNNDRVVTKKQKKNLTLKRFRFPNSNLILSLLFTTHVQRQVNLPYRVLCASQHSFRACAFRNFIQPIVITCTNLYLSKIESDTSN